MAVAFRLQKRTRKTAGRGRLRVDMVHRVYDDDDDDDMLRYSRFPSFSDSSCLPNELTPDQEFFYIRYRTYCVLAIIIIIGF